MNVSRGLSRLSHYHARIYGLRVFLAYGAAALVPYILNRPYLTLTLSLGITAAALTDIDDRFSLRLRNMAMSYIGFFVMSVAIFVLSPYPFIFALTMVVSCFGLIIIGALGRRFAQLSFGCLIVSVYALLGVHHFHHWYEQGLLMMLGAVWYGLLSTLSFLVFPVQVAQQRLSQSYSLLADLLEAKAALFDVDIDPDQYQDAMLALTLANSKVSDSFNLTREALVTRLKGDRGQHDTRRALQYYFIAQDIQERADSSHRDYLALAHAFGHYDVLFRLQRLLMLQAKACRTVATTLSKGKVYQHSPIFQRLFKRLRASIALLPHETAQADNLNALESIQRNLHEIDRHLASCSDEKIYIARRFSGDERLVDDGLQGWKDTWQRIQSNFNANSVLFRHGVRLSTLLVIGYALVQSFEWQQGYWILLTTLFVCQPNFNTTKRRLKLRIYGTISGVILGSFILDTVVKLEGLLIISVLSATLFLHFRTRQYAQATLFLTIFVLINFHLAEPATDAAWARIIFTVIGCALAGLGSMWIFPDWKYRRFDHTIQRTLRAECDYLDEIVRHYQHGPSNDLSYRHKRRQAHSMDSELASVVAALATEPHVDGAIQQQAYRFLTLNHTFLSYISGLGAHRQQLPNSQSTQLLVWLQQAVDSIHGLLLHDHTLEISEKDALALLRQQIMQSDQQQPIEQLIVQQIVLILGILPELSSLKQVLSFPNEDHSLHLAAL